MSASPTNRRITHPAQLDNLRLFLDFIDQACTDERMDADAHFALRLAVEEVCMNLIKHAYAGVAPGPIEIEFGVDGDVARLMIRDRARPFDPDRAPPPNLHDDAMRRPIGGLGWHLIKQLMDRVAYTAATPLGNELALEKHFERRPPAPPDNHDESTRAGEPARWK